MSEHWTADHVPHEAYDRAWERIYELERLLREIRDGKHSLPGTLVQIDRVMKDRPEKREPGTANSHPRGDE